MLAEKSKLTEKSETANPWQTVSSREVYGNPWIRVREDSVIRPDGLPGIYGVVEAKRAIGVIALSTNDEVYLVGQYRYPINRYSWEIIEGGADGTETELQAGQRELAEEAGISARTWKPLGGVVHLSNCFSDEKAYFFLATDLTEGAASPEPTEVLTLRRVPLSQAVQMVHDGEITDAMSVIALLRLERLLSEQP